MRPDPLYIALPGWEKRKKPISGDMLFPTEMPIVLYLPGSLEFLK
jgi:hypothetical protein